MQTVSAVALAGVLFASILVAWVPGLWAVVVPEAGIFALAIAWAVRMAIRPYRIACSAVLLPLAGAVLWGLVQLAAGLSAYTWETVSAVLFWATMLAVCFLGLQIFSNPRLRDGFLGAVLVFGVALAVVSTLQLFTAEGKVFWLFPTPYKSFVLGPFVYKNQYAAFIEMILPLAVVGAIADKRRMPVYVTMAAAMYASVIAATSRAGFILASAEIVLILAAAAARRMISLRRLALLGAAMGACAAVFVVTAGWDSLWKKFEQRDQDLVRRQFFESSLEMTRDRPWTGFGLGTWSTVYPGYARFDNGSFANEAHNDWVQWTAEGGIPFLALMLAIAGWSIRPAAATLWGVGVVSIFCHCLVDYPIQIQRPGLSILLFLLVAALASTRVSKRRHQSELP